MGAHRQLLKDMQAAIAKLSVADNTSSHEELVDELEMRIHGVRTLIGVADVKLITQRTRIANEIPSLLQAFRRDPKSVDALERFLTGSVIPYLRSVCEHEDRERPNIDSETDGVADEMTGAEFGNWRIGNRFAQGAFGKVYFATNSMTARRACAKIIAMAESATEKREQHQRFLREVRAPAEVGHPALVQVYDSYFDDTQFHALVIIMELVNGMRLDNWARGRRDESVLATFCKLLPPLEECHLRGLTHRDLKPSNILVTEQGDIKILDFGLAAAAGAAGVTRSGQIIGTLCYACPEQLRGSRDASATNDIWSLGVVLAEILTGAHPFPHGCGSIATA